MPYISVQYGPNVPWSCCYSYVFLSHAFILAMCLYVCVGVCLYACVTVCFFTFFILCTVYCVCYLSVNKVFLKINPCQNIGEHRRMPGNTAG